MVTRDLYSMEKRDQRDQKFCPARDSVTCIVRPNLSIYTTCIV
jgi:hypothetical protein